MKKAFYIFIILSLVGIVFYKTEFVSAAWYNSSWDYRIAVETYASKVDADLTDYPVFVDLDDMPDSFFTNLNSDGGDIRVTTSNGTTEVPREVVFASTTAKTGELHFKATGTLSGSATTTFYVYYGNSGASDYAEDDAYGRENVWTSSYKAVYHLQEDPSGTVIDSTSHDFDLAGDNMDSSNWATGKLSGYAMDFNGSNEQLKDTNQVWNNADNAVTVQMWSNFLSADAAQNATIFRYTTVGSERNSAHAPWGGNVYWDFGTCCTDGRVSGAYGAYDDKYSLIHFVSNGSTNKIIYIDGVSRYSNMSVADNPNTDLTGLYIGSGGSAEYHNGVLDEFRVATVARTATWISTENNNQSSPSTFYAVGSEESAPSGEVTEVVKVKGGKLILNGKTLIIK